jgi:multiple sugar transport system substrate-binding protein
MRNKLILSRRSLIQRSAAAGLVGGLGGFARPVWAQSDLPDPQSILDRISVEGYVREDYRQLFNMTNEPLWDPSKDWIRNVDWERSSRAGRQDRALRHRRCRRGVRRARALSPSSSCRASVELVPIPDDSMYDKVWPSSSPATRLRRASVLLALAGRLRGARLLAPLDEYAAKWALPLDDFYDTYRLNYGYYGGQLVGIPFDCDIQMIHVRPSIIERSWRVQMTVEIDPRPTTSSCASRPRLTRRATACRDRAHGRAGFWSTYTWEHIAAQHGLMLFNESWEPQLNSDAGIRGLEMMLALSQNAIEGISGAGWGENRAAWLGGQVATNISWQDSGTQATRPDQSTIVDDALTIYEPRVEGGMFAPPNIAGSTSCVTANAQTPKAPS